MPTTRVHTDICARCGCDRKDQRKGKYRCKAWGVLYSSHKWGWDDPDHDNHPCGSCGATVEEMEAFYVE